MRTIGLRLNDSNFTASIARIIRKYRELSVLEIKKMVLNKDYLYKCDIIRAIDVKTILIIRDELNKENINSDICVEVKAINDEYINNLLVSYKETEGQVEAEINEEALLEEGD